jgi:phosphatidylglycerophosphate synthase
VLLAALAATVGLGAAGWLAGVAVGVVTCVALCWGLDRTGATALGPADWVTLMRTVMVGAATALTADSFTRPVPVPLLVGLIIVALILDAVDGKVARSTGTSSPLGFYFDMEVDAFLLLVLSAYVAGSAGWWVLAIGGMRYAFALGLWLLPWMRRTLPPRYWRKVVTAVQGIALVAATASVLPAAVDVTFLAVALGLLVESFGRDVLWLWVRRPAAALPVRARLRLLDGRAYFRVAEETHP